jgi:hypothetical protein
MATLLIGGGLQLWNQAAAKESVDDCPCVEQIGKWSEAGFAMFGAGVRPLVSDFNRFPIGPAGRDERSAAIGKYCKQQQNTAAFYGAHNRQCAALKRVPLAQYPHRTRDVTEMGSV